MLARTLAPIAWLAAMLAAAPPPPPADDRPPELVASTEARTPEDERAAFRLPPGFEAQLVAAEPDINKPMNLAFDDRGRLWVTSTTEYPYPAKDGTTPRDRVLILDDFGPDGRARKVTTFADGLNIPIGVLPLGDGRQALVHSIPNIYLLTDDDGDGRADRKEVAYASIGFQDTHGMASSFTMGLDGWVYGCHGFANTSTVKGADDEGITMNSGNTYRMRPDGSHIEQRTWGQVNPFGLAFDPRGNLYSADCHSRPIYQLLPGAYYPSFGKPDDGLGYGPEMMQHDHGSTGIAGVAVLASDSFPPTFRDNLLIGNVVTSRINRDHLEWKGSSPRAVAEPDFLVSEDPWFRPVSIVLGPDGALYVGDFYNRIIGHYEVPLTHPGRDRERGRIWRIAYKGPDAPTTPPPNGGDFSGATAAELIDALDHPNLAVRTRATHVLAGRGREVLESVKRAIASPASPMALAHGLYVLARLGGLDEATLIDASRHEDPLVRIHAIRLLTESDALGDAGRSAAAGALKDADPLVRRTAAQALGRHVSASNLRPLLDARHAADPEDDHLIHVVRMVLRDQLRDARNIPAIDDEAFNDADRRTLADVANGVPSLDAARFQLAYLKANPDATDDLVRFEEHIARYGDGALDADLVAFARGNRPEDRGLQAAQLEAIHRGLQGRGAPLPAEARAWAVDLATTLLDADDPGRVALGAALAANFRLVEARDQLQRMGRSRDLPEDRRLQAFGALAAADPSAAVATLAAVLRDPSESTGLRNEAAKLLGQGGRPEAKEALLEALPVIEARHQAPVAEAVAADRDGAERLLAAIAAGKASPRLLQARPVEVKLRQAGLPELDARLGELTAGLPPADQVIQELIAGRQAKYAAIGEFDAEKGAAAFGKYCASCHQMRGEGARIGPQLDGIGARGADRLMEDVLDPNRNVDQAFRATTIALDDGRVFSGLVLSDEGEVIILADAQGKEIRIPKATVEERRVAPISPMPANWSEQIPEDDFYALIGFLSASREAPPE